MSRRQWIQAVALSCLIVVLCGAFAVIADSAPTKKPNGPAVVLQRKLDKQLERIEDLEAEVAELAGALYVFQSCTAEMSVELVRNEGDPDWYLVEAPPTPEATYMLMLDPDCRKKP